MAVLKIITDQNNPVLRGKAEKVTIFDDSLKKLVGDMFETMLKEEGVGLAAPQIGVNKKIILVTINALDNNQKTIVLPLINPKIIKASKEIDIGEEGCLSVPGKFYNIKRNKKITIAFQDLEGNEKIMELSDFNARVTQHEMDHLAGVLFIDKIENFPPFKNQSGVISEFQK